ncbi:hypothetical protein A2U01_0054142, partial [Trifolium medium]|nr:hypothetical protein [Trifolium medium]
MHVKFDDKVSDLEKSEQTEKPADTQYDSEVEDSEHLLTRPFVSSIQVEASETNNDLPESDEIQVDEQLQETETNAAPRNTFKYKSSHPEELIIGNKESPRKTRSSFRCEDSLVGLIFMIEPTKIEEALKDDAWIVAM